MKKDKILVCGLVLIALLSSCYSKIHMTNQSEFKNYSVQKSVWVMKAETTAGDSIHYSRRHPGILKDTAVISYFKHKETISKSEADSFHYNFNETRIRYFWLDGKKYPITNSDDVNFTYDVPDTLVVPFRSISGIDAIKFEKGQTAFAMVTGIALAVGTLVYIFITQFTFDLDMGM